MGSQQDKKNVVKRFFAKTNFFNWQFKKIRVLPIAACFITALSLLALSIYYTNNLQTMVEEENYRYLQEISYQINTNMKDKLNSHYAVINALGSSIERDKGTTLPTILTYLNEQKDNYLKIALIDDNGYIYSNSGRTMYPDLIPFISKMRDQQIPVTTSVINLEHQDSVAFLHPLSNIVIDGVTFNGIIAISDMSTLSDTLSLTMFENHGYGHIVTDTGNVVIRSNNENNNFYGYNILTYFKDRKSLEGISVEGLQNKLRDNQSGQLRYTDEDGETLVFYAPVGYQDWYLFSLIPSKILTERTSGFYWQTVIACLFLTVIFVSLIIIIVLSQQKRKRELMEILYTDPITDGLSKLKFEIDVAKAIENLCNQYTILYINIDKFKYLNEQVGRLQGDLLLKRIYEIINDSLIRSNHEYVSRLMADHFGVLMHDQDIKIIKQRIKKIDDEIKQYSCENHFPITIKLTYGLYPLDKNDRGSDISVMLDKANMARRTITLRNSRIAIAVYNDALKHKIMLEQELEAKQETALINGEFKMYLQPKYDPQTNKIAGAEALTRWISDEGMIFPDQFIPLFESNGFIVNLDLFIFEEACRFIDKLIKQGYQPIPVSVNLSRVNLNIPNFIDKYVEIWKKYNFNAGLLEFEITENLIYDNMELLDKTIKVIHEHGFLVSMDDFGSGYSSLNMLKNVDVDFVKLDREFFLSNNEDIRKGEVIINAMIDLCKELGICVVSEGIETEGQVKFLRKLGCDLIQGYYYSKPISQEELLERIIDREI